ncbi:MAG: S9 family peptidase [Chitinophagaceae bacterium]|nr:S9 family peptidase [Chitinophagaceae bacterium]
MRNIITLLALVLIATSGMAQDSKKDITLEDIWKKGTFRMRAVPGFNAMKDGLRYTQLDASKDQQSIAIYNLATGTKQSVIFDNNSHKYQGHTLSIADYSFSEDETKLLLLTEPQNIYRRSVLYKTYVFDIATHSITQVHSSKVLHPSLSPDNSKIAYVLENNLYYQQLATGATTQVTNDGERNSIINGNCDWVYEEEFEFTKAYQWSPKGNYLAYYRFDERQVPLYTMTLYDSLYPTPYQYKYPKAGEPNATVSIHIHNIASGTTTLANVGTETDQYIPRIKWTLQDNSLCIYRMNRLQNKLELLLANATNGSTHIIFTEENKAFIEVNDNLEFLQDQQSFIYNSERSGYNHLYHYNYTTARHTALTSGNYDIENIVGIDHKAQLVYYTAAQASPLQRQLYVVGFNGKARRSLTPTAGTHSITPCQGLRYFLDKHSSLSSVPIYTLIDASGRTIRTLEDNHALAATMAQYRLGNIRTTTIRGTDALLNAWMITPPDFDSTKKYPVLMYQYSGPGSQMVADKFPVGDYFWHQMLAAKGYIIFCADGTGTGYRGEAFKKKTYLQLGNLESNDQIAVAHNLAQLPYIDANRIGIWGWSFGGFMSSTCMLKGNGTFKAGIAVAPVTNWRYYDNIYTERYMRTPLANPQGYDNNAPEHMAAGLQGSFLLIHGTADDNVHFQNSVMLAEQLIQAGHPFQDAYYPNKAHGISGGNTRLHLYTRMTQFIQDHL